MKRSDYSQRQICEVMTAGIVGHKRKVNNRENVHRKGAETERSRRLKKLTGKTTWYKGKKRTTVDKDETKKGTPTMRQDKRGKRSNRPRQTVETDRKAPAAVMFIERTKDGGLATELKKKETEINKISRHRIKVVERNGEQIQGVLTNPNPWGQDR